MLRNVTSGAVVARHMRKAASPWQRMAGLIGARALDPEGGLWIEPCSAIHTIGMRFAIDVVFLDRTGRVVALASDVPPLRPSIAHRGTAIVVELPAGRATHDAICVGDELVYVNSDSRSIENPVGGVPSLQIVLR
jgi:uncharacterized membrane protein (UPF0127 family)